MFLYKFGYGSYEEYEESEFFEILHEKHFSEEEFNKIIIDSIIDVLQDFVDSKLDLYVHDDGISYQTIHEYVIEKLKKVGFKELQYEATWSCFGWPSITNKSSWSGQRDDKLNEIYWKIPDDIKNSINNIAKEKMRERSKRYDMRYRRVLSGSN